MTDVAVDNVPKSSAGKPNRMERRRLETRAKLLSATLEQVIENGIDKTTMDGITEAADLGRRTLYYHFSSKEECILAAVAQVYENHAAAADQTPAGSTDPAFIIARHCHTVLAGLLREPVTARLVEFPKLLASALQEAIGQFALRDIRSGIAAGRFNMPMAEPVLDRMLIWSLVGLIIEGADDETTTADLLAAYCVTVLTILGIPAKEARKLNDKAERELASR